MDSFEWSKIAGWLLTALIAVLGLSIVTGSIFAPGAPEQKGYVVEGVEEEASGGAAVEAEKPIAFYLATANPTKGEAQFKKCASCHTINQGGANGIGPNLYGTVGMKMAGHAGFGYSDALKTKGGVWSWDELNEWLKSPKSYIPGNKMSFAGLSKPQDRADVIAYLNAQSAAPKPYPAVPAEVAAAAPAAPTDAPAAGTSGDTPGALPGKAPDTVEETPNPVAAGTQPQNNRGGPAAVDVVGREKDDRQQ